MVFGLPEGFRPMKGEAAELSDIKFPCLASPKIDGFRCIVGPGGVALSAALKPIPNQFVQDYFKRHANALTGLDGELVVGAPNDPAVFDKTSGALRRKTGEPDFTFWVFDDYTRLHPFRQTVEACWVTEGGSVWPSRVGFLSPVIVFDRNRLQALMQKHVASGFEGTMVRSPDGPYKHGRSTKKEGYLLKLKPFRDDEAIILGLEEQHANTNTATKDERGLTKRSSHKAGKIGKGTLGGFRVRVLTGPFKGVETVVGTGVLTKAERQHLWWMDKGEEYNAFKLPDGFPTDGVLVGKVLTFKHMAASGGYKKPRHAGFLRFRPDFDLPTE